MSFIIMVRVLAAFYGLWGLPPPAGVRSATEDVRLVELCWSARVTPTTPSLRNTLG